MPIGPILMWYSVALGLLGLALIARGLIGHRVGVDPHCRTCGYNLRARDRSRMYERCAECGAELDRPHAMVLGRWERVHRFIQVGLVFVMVSLPMPVGRAFLALTGLASPANRPAWLLEMDLRWGGDDARVTALTEVVRRLNAGAVEHFDFTRLAAIGLSRPLPKTALEQDQWRQIFNVAWKTGVPREALKSAVMSTLDPTVLSVSDGLGPPMVGLVYHRPSATIADDVKLYESDVRLWLDGREVPQHLAFAGDLVFAVREATTFRRNLALRSGVTDPRWHAVSTGDEPLKPGTYPVEVEARLELRPPGQAPIARVVRAKGEVVVRPPRPPPQVAVARVDPGRPLSPLAPPTLSTPAFVGRGSDLLPPPGEDLLAAMISGSGIGVAAMHPRFPKEVERPAPASPARPAATASTGGTTPTAAEPNPAADEVGAIAAGPRGVDDFYRSTPFFDYQAELAARTAPQGLPPPPESVSGPMKVDARVFLPHLPPAEPQASPRRGLDFGDLIQPTTRPARGTR